MFKSIRYRLRRIAVYFVLIFILLFVSVIGPCQLFFRVDKVFALNDTTQTWTFNTTNAGNYTYNGNVSVTDSGATLYDGGGTGADGAVTISNTKIIDTDIIASGRTSPDAINYNIATSVPAGASTINVGTTPNGIVVGDEILIINLRDPNNADATTYGKVDNGTATSGSTNTLTDSSKSWTTDAYANMTVIITSGTGNQQSLVIASNTSNTLTTTSNWTTTPDATSVYQIINPYALNSTVVTSISTSATSTTLQDTTKSWTTNAYANMTVMITGGTGQGQVRTISSNTANTLTVSSAWTTQINTSLYKIVDTTTWNTTTNIGTYETRFVTAINGQVLTLDSPLVNAYNGTIYKIMLQRVPQYTNVTIQNGGTFTVSAYNNTTGKGGVLFFRASGDVTVESGGTITAAGKGYAGGSVGNPATGGITYNGVGGTGNGSGGQGGGGGNTSGVRGAGTIGGGGGAGGNGNAGAGGGGGYGTVGGGGVSGGVNGSGVMGGNGGIAGGGGGGTYGSADLSTLFFGSGGGGTRGWEGKNGGSGGGIIVIKASAITVAGSVSANGADGLSPIRTYVGSSGGGAGGSIYLSSLTMSLGSSLVTANGGLGPTAGTSYKGGDGGAGRIAIYSPNLISGTTNPTYATAATKYISSSTIYVTTAANPTTLFTWDSVTENATKPSGTEIYYQWCTDTVTNCNSGNSWQYWTGSAWVNASNTTSHRNTAATLTQSVMQQLSTTNKKLSFKAILVGTNTSTPVLNSVAVGYTTDITQPPTNASSLHLYLSSGGREISANGWVNNATPYFSWTAGADNDGGSGLKGYCLYLGTDSDGNPATAKGLLGTSPVSTANTTCQFIVSGINIDFATTTYRGSTWLTSSSSPYYLNIKAVDNSGNIYDGSSTQFQFRFDNTSPSNPSFVSTPADYISTKSATILWSSSGDDGPSDSSSGVAGLQYRIGESGIWYGDNHTGLEDNTDLLENDGSYTTNSTYDYASLQDGNNLIYFRTWDNAGNVISTYVSGSIKLNTTAPSAPQSLTVTPSDNTTNSYAFSWSAPATYTGQANNITYCYTVNTLPTISICTFTGAGVTSLSADAFATQPGINTFYVVAKDEAGNINYDVYSSVSFTYSGTAPGIPRNVDIADISIKATSSWKLAISWDAPTDVGAGVSSYKIYRSITNTTCSSSFSSFSYIGATAGSSYSDTGLTQQTYYYCIKACDSANSCSAVSGTVSKYPDGKFTSAAGLTSGPTVSSITTKKATIAWSTDRTSDSKIQYGTSTGSYFTEEVSNSSQVTSHSITLTSLSAGTRYYYKAKWTDEDGNTGTSDEQNFTTDAAPVIMGVEPTYINVDSVIIQFTARGASKIKLYYGPTTSFGGLKELSTATSETTYNISLTGLADGTKYYFKINPFDSESQEYENQINDFTTLPRPQISLVQIKEAKGAATPTVLVIWESNTGISSIVTYYPKADAAKTRDEVDVNLKEGAHTMFVRNLLANTDYLFIVSGRDKIGNEARSKEQSFTTATDTRPPQISGLTIEASSVPPVGRTGEAMTAQLVVSWNTDEAATGQVEFGEGTGTTYNQKTQEDQTLTYNHLVIVSGLTPSKVYHPRALSKDKAGNLGNSIDTVTITPKAVDNALDLVISNLREAFGFLK